MKTGITVFVGSPFRDGKSGRVNNRKDHIIDTVGNYYGVDLRIKNRKREIVFPRQVAMLMLGSLYNMGVVEIGKEFGKRHATVIHAVKRVNGICDTNPETKKEVEEIKMLLQ